MNASDVYGAADLPLLTADEATAFDRAAQERHGVPGRVLMENAGRAAALLLDRIAPEGRVVAAVGGGNNGGDALVLLRTLRTWGREAAYVPVGSREPEGALLHDVDVPSVPVEEASRVFAGAAVLIDGMLGTGIRGAPREPAASVIREMNASRRPILALDVPSGADPTTGAVPAEAVRATATVTFGWPKQGLIFQPARAHCGRLVTVDIAFPPHDRLSEGEPPGVALITSAWAREETPERPPDAHKGTFGRLLIAAGRPGMAGAAAIAGRGAVRAGAGLVYLASDPANRGILQTRVPEAVFAGGETARAESAERSDAIVAGPGIGTDDGARRALDALLARTSGRPTLLDADALTLLGRRKGALRELAGDRPLVITPHPGEFERLTGESPGEIRGRVPEAARACAERLGCVVLLKGMPSVVAAPDGLVRVNTVGSSDLASAGTGDLLAGVIGAFLANGTDAAVAAALGLFHCGRAADLAGLGRALTPDDAADHLARAFADPGPRASSLELPFVRFDQPRRR